MNSLNSETDYFASHNSRYKKKKVKYFSGLEYILPNESIFLQTNKQKPLFDYEVRVPDSALLGSVLHALSS